MKKGLIGIFLFGLISIAACHKSTITPDIYQQFTTDSLAIVAFLDENHINAIRHDSVWFLITEPGTGPYPTRYNCVTIRYTGTELGATTSFESNTTTGLKGPLKGLISGMQIGLKKFPQGSKGTLYIPSALAYGPGGKTDVNGNYIVHPSTPLIFDIELVSLSDYNVPANYCYQ